jgi:RNA polymerase sigma-70 factor (ECF subfamily)
VELVQLAVLAADEASSAAGDPAAITLAAFDGHAIRLARYVRSFGLSHDETEDVIQETFLALFTRLSLERETVNLAGWLFRVAHNLALKHHRAIRRRPLHCSCDEPEAQGQVAGGATPECDLISRERRARLGRVVAALAEKDRRCLQLRAEGLAYRDIGKTLGISLGAVARSLTRVMTRLMAAVEGHADV